MNKISTFINGVRLDGVVLIKPLDMNNRKKQYKNAIPYLKRYQKEKPYEATREEKYQFLKEVRFYNLV